MPRDVLLVLVLVAVLLNLALLVGVGIARWRLTGAPARPRPRAVHDATSAQAPIHPPPSARTRPAAWSPTGVRPRPAVGVPQRARPITTPFSPESGGPPQPLPSAPEERAGATGLATTTATLEVEPEDLPEDALPAMPDEPPASPNGAESAAPQADLATRRGRRFVMPRNDEDRGRTERAIEAFLGEPAPSGSSSTHRPRRRARRQRPPGDPAGPLVLVAALGGFDQLRQTLGREGAVRFAEAYGEALRATLRSGDHVTDLGQGRLRLVVHADEEGAQALMDRARAVCEPWLRLAPVPLALRVRPMPDARSTNGHRPDGQPDGRRDDGRTVERPASAPDPARPTAGRPTDGDGRRLAAG